MDLNLIIKDILTRREGLVIPGLGSLVTEEQSAKINREKKVIKPPRRITLFKPEVKKDDDEVLAHHLAKSENIQLDEARSRINDFVGKINQKLDEEGKYEVKGIGTFSKTEQGTIELIPEEGIVSDLGFGEIVAEPFELETQPQQKKAYSPPPPPPRKRPIKKILLWTVLGIFILVIAGGGYYTGFFDYLAYKIEREKPFRQLLSQKPKKRESATEQANQETTKSADPAAAIEDSSEATKDTALPEAIKKSLSKMTDKKQALMYKELKDTTDYYIVAGSFRRNNNAEEFSRQLIERDYKPEILEMDNLFRVTVKSFDKKEDALVRLYQMRDSSDLKSIWLLSVPEKDR